MADRFRALAIQVIDAYRVLGKTIATAESCTGGLVSAALTSIAGSSLVFERGFVTYSNRAKIELLGVDPTLIERQGAVSGDVAAAMAEGALTHSTAWIAVSVTGIAGPDGGSAEKPVGTVWFGLSVGGSTTTECALFAGDREAVRAQATERALSLLLQGLDRLG